MKRLLLVLLCVGALSGAPALAQITIPNTLVAGTTIRAGDLNTNFSTLGNHALDRLSGGNVSGNITLDSGITIDGLDLSTALCATCAVTHKDLTLTSPDTGITVAGVNIVNSTGKIPALSSTYVTDTAGLVPTGSVVFTTTGACATGWTEYTTARGRYIVGLVSAGTNGATVGTSLSNSEDRAVGQHTHIQDAHTHGQTRSTSGGGATTDFSVENTRNTTYAASASTTQSTVATNQNSGSVAGTNAPYVQLMACVKS